MTAILRRLPFHENADEVAVGLERVRIRPYQIIVWVSLSAKSVLELPHTRRGSPPYWTQATTTTSRYGTSTS